MRVSSSGQAEEGRSGLPRQITRIHEAAAKNGICIPWDMVYADDHTGFEFRDRPELSKLRDELKNPDRLADDVVIEYLDRLSRNADWHQGFLLDEMEQHNLQALFWKGFSSRIERAVMGAISQDGMERELQNMYEGTLDKARSGRITAKTPNYGYIFVDAEGKESPKVKKETYYAPHPEESLIVELIFQKVALEGMSTRAVAYYLEGRIPPPRKYQYWEPRQIGLFIRNPVYKGEFVCHRWEHVKVPAKHQRPGEPIRMVSAKRERPRDEWIIVPVPPLVSEELWEAANAMMDKNAKMSSRNSKLKYLLTGLTECAECGYAYSGACRTYHRKDGGKTLTRSYRCTSRSNRVKVIRDAIGCTQGGVNSDVIEDAVWHSICQVLLEPEQLLAQLDEELAGGERANLQKQMSYIQKQIRNLAVEDEKLYKAYIADVFDANEFAARRQLLKERESTLQNELDVLSDRQVTTEQIEADKALILEIAEALRAAGTAIDAPYELKNRIIRMVVEKVMIDAANQTFELYGFVKGTHALALSGSIASSSAGRDLTRQS
ncbi:MAG: recombinase family protein [Chloroflexota bacterium]